jgi:hypothetical protein
MHSPLYVKNTYSKCARIPKIRVRRVKNEKSLIPRKKLQKISVTIRKYDCFVTMRHIIECDITH